MAAHTDEPTERRRRLPSVSVRTRIIAVIALVSALGMVSVGVVVYIVERGRILQQIDDLLEANLESARFIVAEGDTESGTDGEPVPWASSADALRAVVQRISPDDNTGALGIVDGVASIAPGVRLDIDLQGSPGFPAHATAATADGSPVIGTFAEEELAWRYMAAPIAVEGSPTPETVLFTLVYDVDAELAELNVATRVYLIACIIAVAVIAAVGAFVATRLLRPLRQMRETAERVSAQSLSERLPVEGRDDVSDLARTMNEMLDRLDDALDSQRRLLSDVGHELKTPITIVRGYVEVMDPFDPDDVRDTRRLAVDELDRMGSLVQDLAGAAALHGPSPIAPRPVDAADLVRQIVRKAAAIEGAAVSTGPIADVVADVDARRITQAVLQLAQNAVTHGGGDVVIGSRLVGPEVEFWVRDHGPGVPDDAKQRIFERFQRGAERDGRGSAGSGLGLNIVQVIARAHGGSADVLDASGGGAVFTITVPRGTASPLTPRGPEHADIPPRPPLPGRETADAVARLGFGGGS